MYACCPGVPDSDTPVASVVRKGKLANSEIVWSIFHKGCLLRNGRRSVEEPRF